MAYISLAVRQEKSGYVPGAGFFTCGLVTLEEYKILLSMFSDGVHTGAYIHQYAQNETITLENHTTDQAEIAVLIKTFGESYVIQYNLIEHLLEMERESLDDDDNESVS